MEKTTLEDVKKTIRSVMKELIEEDPETFDENSLLIEELGINSITIVQIFLSCQDKYDIVLANEMNLAEPMSIRSLAEIVLNKINTEV
ncbi:MAG: acyl carrier protein [Eubacterium sp.]|nr:acyl carrier protein [Eubacterium sp.]